MYEISTNIFDASSNFLKLIIKASIWCENMLESADISKSEVQAKLSFEEQMSKNNFSSIVPHQIDVTVLIILPIFSQYARF